uniref:putative RuBisCO transcriptional regulator n=1 Tax=Scytothamnus australis TaxID=66621 RepID=UPI002E78BFA1|nr:putative RuBisCO transcriptional regulator [Scytothamnus australis]WAM64709.1 putative RuBisCO transcriptional regulator [Scytothamnus australis]
MSYFSFNLEQLKILQILKRKNTLREASKELYISQPALSLQIKKLEYKINSPILDRNQQQICFTRTGELVLDYAKSILGLCDEAEKAIKCLKNFRKASLSIGSNETIGTYLLPKIINLFSKRYPYAHISLEIGCTNNLAWNVANGKLNVGIIGEKEIPKELHQLLKITPYFREEIVLILPKTYGLTEITKIDLKELYNLNFITLKHDLIERKFIDTTLEHFNIKINKLKVKFELNSMEAIKRAVQAGLGVSFVSKLIAKDELASNRFQLLKVSDKKINNYLTIIVNSKIYQSSLTRKFYRHCFYILKIDTYKKFLNLDY